MKKNTDEKLTLLKQTEWYPSFKFLTTVKYFAVKHGNKKAKIAGHLVSLVLGNMWFRSMGKNQMFSASMTTLQNELGLGDSTVKRAIKVLEDLGVVVDTGQFTEFQTKIYWVLEEKILELNNKYVAEKPVVKYS